MDHKSISKDREYQIQQYIDYLIANRRLKEYWDIQDRIDYLLFDQFEKLNEENLKGASL